MNCWRQQSQTYPGDDEHFSQKQVFSSENADNKSHKSEDENDESLGLDMINRSDCKSNSILFALNIVLTVGCYSEQQ